MPRRRGVSVSGRGARLGVAAGVCAVLAGGAGACRSVRGDEALAMLDVSAGPGVPAFTTARFSVAGRAEISPHEVRYDGRAPLKFGYYLPGPNGTLRVTGQALSASCLVGAGSVEVEVQLGRMTTPVALVIAPLAELDPACLASRDGGQDGADAGVDASAAGDAAKDAPNDAPNDAPKDATAPDAGDVRPADAGADVRDAGDAMPDVSTQPPPPVCMAATKPCPGASACCSGLVCGTTTLGSVCCGNFNMTCTRAGGEDCCGQLECVSGHCCLPATYSCSGSSSTSCCSGLVCGTTSLGKVCCGNQGAPCKRADGADCCGALECVNGTCR